MRTIIALSGFFFIMLMLSFIHKNEDQDEQINKNSKQLELILKRFSEMKTGYTTEEFLEAMRRYQKFTNEGNTK